MAMQAAAYAGAGQAMQLFAGFEFDSTYQF
jgi:hypothetical protein